MKKGLIKIISVLCTAFVMLQALPAAVFADETEQIHKNESTGQTWEEAPLYGRNALAALSDAETLLYVYDSIYNGVESSKEEINIYDGKNSVSEEQLSTALDAYLRDHGEHFWLGNTYSYSYSSVTLVSFYPSYVMSGDTLENARQEFDLAIEEMVSRITPVMSDYERELYLHDLLVSKVTYSESQNAHNAYGAIVEGVAVCEGYAEAMQTLLKRVGIECFAAYGASLSPATGKSENHAWNYVKIDGIYYHLDPTWNDQGEMIFHMYFNIAEEELLQDHVLTETNYPLPVCEHGKYYYFDTKDRVINAQNCTAEHIASLLKADGMSVGIYAEQGSNAFIGWFAENIMDIVKECSLTGSISYGYAALGKEVYISVEAECAHTELEKIEQIPCKCLEDGRVEYYQCSCGKRFADENAARRLVGSDSLIIYRKGHDWANACVGDSRTCRDCAETEGIHTVLYVDKGKEYKLYYQTRERQDGALDYRFIVVANVDYLEGIGSGVLTAVFTDGSTQRTLSLKINTAYYEIDAVDPKTEEITFYVANEGAAIMGCVVTGVPAEFKLGNNAAFDFSAAD